MLHALVVLLAIILGVGRFLITPRLNLPTAEGVYEAFAHLFIGALIGAAAVRRSRLYVTVVVGLTLIELVAFLVQRRGV